VTPRRWLVTGAGGMLGTDLVTVLREAGHDVTGVTRADLDLLDPLAVLEAVAGHDVVVNCAAWTAVDRAETEEGAAFASNAVIPANLARGAARHGSHLIQVSTDYVLSGESTSPYAEDAPLAPRSAYGRTKAAGEWATLAGAPGAAVVRVAYLYGAHGPSFVRTMARLAGERDVLRVVDDQRGQPTWTVDAARRILLVGEHRLAGVWHATNAGEATWAGLARAVVERLGVDPERVHAITTAEYPLPAPRPAYSVLGHQRWATAGLGPARPWQEALDEALPLVVPR
jgi:dTDP-4-dehydrorhamnose reductase